MVRSLSQNWWLVFLRGVLAILFGVSAIIWPGITWLTLIILFGVYAIVDGLIAIWTGFSRTRESPRWWTFLLEGLVNIGAGVMALIWPDLATLVLVYLIASWAVFTGILEIVAAIRLRSEITNEWFLALGGVLSVGLGILLFLQPAAGTIAIIWMIAGYALVFGILLVILGIRLRNWKESDTTIPLTSTR
ncbi:MAG TPA: HdeD family acid-resistance protein [Anaerolineales bacterium]|nr:HdeD family acid-resistance protein [Anaerolineales bacterium]